MQKAAPRDELGQEEEQAAFGKVAKAAVPLRESRDAERGIV